MIFHAVNVIQYHDPYLHESLIIVPNSREENRDEASLAMFSGLSLVTCLHARLLRMTNFSSDRMQVRASPEMKRGDRNPPSRLASLLTTLFEALLFCSLSTCLVLVRYCSAALLLLYATLSALMRFLHVSSASAVE